MRFEGEALDFSDVLMVPQPSELTSRRQVDIARTFKFKRRPGNIEYTGIPVVASNMDSIASFAMSEALNHFQMQCCLHKFHNTEENFENLANHLKTVDGSVMTIGISNVDYEYFTRMFDTYRSDVEWRTKGPFWVCIDVANGYTRSFREYISKVRENREEDLIIIAGNVVTKEMTINLIEAGADIVKVGIGPGAACITRKITGVGVPQFTAVEQCADGAHGAGGMIISDGGCKVVGDICKAIAVGADFVMLGGMLSGYEECLDPKFGISLVEKQRVEWVAKLYSNYPDGTPEPRPEIFTDKFVQFRGMSSREAMEEHYGEMASYRASEGKQVLVPYKGTVQDKLKEICGGLRSACTYLGARELKEVHRRATFVTVRRQLNNMFK